MQAKIERIGDGFGLLLPKELLDACGFGTEATITVQNRTLVVSPRSRRPREGWAEAVQAIPQGELNRDFAEMQALRKTPDAWTSTEWQWPDTDSHAKV